MRYECFMGLDIFHCPGRGRATRFFLLLAFPTAHHGAGLRAVSGFAHFPLPRPRPGYARFLASRISHCPPRGWATRGFCLRAFSTARHEAGLRAVSPFSHFPLPGPGPGYARFLLFHFSHCPPRGRATRIFLLLAFSTARHGAGLRAVSYFSHFPLPATGPGYAHFPTSRISHCPP